MKIKCRKKLKINQLSHPSLHLKADEVFEFKSQDHYAPYQNGIEALLRSGTLQLVSRSYDPLKGSDKPQLESKPEPALEKPTPVEAPKEEKAEESPKPVPPNSVEPQPTDEGNKPPNHPAPKKPGPKKRRGPNKKKKEES